MFFWLSAVLDLSDISAYNVSHKSKLWYMWIRWHIVQYVNTKVSEEYNYLHLHCGSGGGYVIQSISNLSAKQYGICLQKTVMFILTAMNISVSLSHMFNLC